jgi:hypothetical protein
LTRQWLQIGPWLPALVPRSARWAQPCPPPGAARRQEPRPTTDNIDHGTVQSSPLVSRQPPATQLRPSHHSLKEPGSMYSPNRRRLRLIHKNTALALRHYKAGLARKLPPKLTPKWSKVPLFWPPTLRLAKAGAALQGPTGRPRGLLRRPRGSLPALPTQITGGSIVEMRPAMASAKSLILLLRPHQQPPPVRLRAHPPAKCRSRRRLRRCGRRT